MERLRQQFTRTGEFAPDTSKLERKIKELPVPISWEKTLQDQFDEADRLARQIASTPTVAQPPKDNTIANFQNLVASALTDGTKEAAKQNKISGLDARSQAGLNFLLESGVAGKKPEEKTAKNTAEAVVLLKQIRDLDKVDLTVSIP